MIMSIVIRNSIHVNLCVALLMPLILSLTVGADCV